MKIVINRKSLNKCLDVVSRALILKTTLPIYDNVLLHFVDGKCYVYGSNSTLQIRGVFAAESPEEVKMCIPGMTFMNTTRLLSEEEINFNYDPEKFVLNISAKKKKYKITGVNPKDFGIQTIPEEANTFKLLSSKIIPQIASISKVVKWDDLRTQLSGITIATREDDIHVSGTNEALFFCRAILGVKSDKDFEVVLPKDISIALGSMVGTGDLEMAISDRSIFCTLEGFEMYSTLVNVKKVVCFDQFFTHNRKESIVVDKNEILMSLKRLLNYSSENAIVRMEVLGNELKMSCENNDFGRDAEEVLDIKNSEAPDCVVGISIKFLSTIINSLNTEKLKIYLLHYKKPVFLQRYEDVNDDEVWGCAPMLLVEHSIKK